MSVVIYVLAAAGVGLVPFRPLVALGVAFLAAFYSLEWITARKVTLHASDARAVLDADGGDLSQELIAKLQRMAGDHAR